ncbi:DHH family phosphoesterase, partial [Patescibacteria group bacterium]|nr:DHH family phosphoesterase [Patescibacteria group bacterium]
MNKKWIIKPKYPQEFAEKMPGYSPIVLQLLYDRGLDTHKKVDEFLNPDYTQDIHDPFLFNDMRKAVARINKAIKDKEKILIYGDYDADGVTASAVLVKTLEKLAPSIQEKNIEVFIPHRETDGYGLNLKNCQKFIDEKINLIITVDCGITNVEQIEFLKKAGVDTIITDHHIESEKLPNAVAILNPSVKKENYPFKKLAGVGVAFKLAQAIFDSQNNNLPQPLLVRRGVNNFEAFEKWLLDLVTIGTIGDVSPILGENRTLVKYGLMVLNKTQRKGLRELIRVSSLSNGHDPNSEIPLGEDIYELNVRNVSWQIVPRINAAGRIDHANLAYNLLTTDDEVEAIALAQDINSKNLERQKIAE